MNPARYERIGELFEQAMGVPESKRGAWLDAECAGDAGLRAEVEALLEADQHGLSFLDDRIDAARRQLDARLDDEGRTSAEPTPIETRPHADTKAVQAIGRYRVIRRIARGGMGAVYEAEQDSPRRRVALKMVDPHLASEALRARFQREGEILGRLQHPGIAQVYEAGVEDGRPYFAMELIQGGPVTKFADTHGLKMRDRLALLARVCDAVEYAHGRGIVHRDLKPDNVFVTEEGHPKVLDFGIARVVEEAESSLAATMTREGQVLGTLAYMSPEQVSGKLNEITPRTDVYALGVIAFELLTRRLPHDLAGLSWASALRAIEHGEPPRLTTIDGALRGDVETIISTALEKDAARRYASAGGLAADIRRYLAERPIVARRASRVYRARKFVRRNRAVVIGTGAVFGVLVAGLAATSWQAAAAANARDTARGHLRLAERELERSTALNEFLRSVLGSVNPAFAKGRDTSVLEQVLDSAIRRLENGALINQPVVEADLRATLAQTYGAIGERARAMEVLQPTLERVRELEPQQAAEYISTFQVYATELSVTRRLDDASKVYERILGWSDAGLLSDTETETALSNYANVLSRLGQLDRSIAMQQKALELRRAHHGHNHPNVGAGLANLAGPLQNAGRYDEALAYLDDAMRIFEAQERPMPVHRSILLNNRAGVLRLKGLLEQAEAAARESLAVGATIWDDHHPSMGMSHLTLATVLDEQGKFSAALDEYRRARDIYTSVEGPDHPATAQARIGETIVLGRLGHDPVELADELGPAFDVLNNTYGPEHPVVEDARARIDGFFARESGALSGSPAAVQWRQRGRVGPQSGS
jgi:tetratricopeptide (TPR) repeat protein/tRNA A-37 threonylcarbamoyl transferase component Bud32